MLTVFIARSNRSTLDYYQPLPVRTPVQPMPESVDPGQVQQTWKANKLRSQTALLNKNGASRNLPASASASLNHNSSISQAI